MPRRHLHALLLSLAFMMAWVYFTAPDPSELPPADTLATAEDPDPGLDTAAGGEPDVGAGAGVVPPGAPRALAEDSPIPDAPEITVDFGGRDFDATWQSRGASLQSMHLLDYKTSLEDDSPLALLGPVDGDAGNFLLRDNNGLYGLDRVHWALIEEGTTAAGFRRLVWAVDTGDGYRIRRIVTELDQPFSFGLAIEIENTGAERSKSLSLALESARGLIDEEAGSQWYGAPTALAELELPSREIEVTKWSGGDLRGETLSVREGDRLVSAGAMITYFTSVLRPLESTDVRSVSPFPVLDLRKLERDIASKEPRSEREAERWRAELAPDFETNAAVDLLLLVPPLDPGGVHTFDFEVFSGPKALEIAGEPGLGFLSPIIESTYGFMPYINRMLLQVLRFFHGIFGNWGVAIIVLTIIVKAALFPLNRRQQSSMQRYAAAMQRLKPQLDELKKKYKNNTRKFNEEQMKLLRAEGATPPLGGCLLTFLQFPIWISLFQILGTSIELRQSRFMFWVQDLSRPDAMPLPFDVFGLQTLNVLPLLMSAATIISMRSQPKPGDASQAQMQKIMGTVMPLVMLFVLYGYSSGLSLYIFTSSLIGIFEIRVIRRFWPVPGNAVAQGGNAAPAPSGDQPPAAAGSGGKGKGKGKGHGKAKAKA